jgi:hypothetical protein
MQSMFGLNSSSFDGRGGSGLRGCGHADSSGARQQYRGPVGSVL